ncbi:MAG: glycosyltransferase family 4 protein [Chthoniobacterales bacterium]
MPSRAAKDINWESASTAEAVAHGIPWLVIGLGSTAYGKERRAITTLKHSHRISPYFLTTVWEDGSVSEMLRANGLEFTPVTIGYLGRARLRWTLVNLWHMPALLLKVLRVYRAQECRGIVVLALLPFANVLPALLILRLFFGARLVFYLGDIPANTGPNRALARLMQSTADAIIVNSKAVLHGLETVGIRSERIQVAYNGLELERFKNAAPFPWREQFGWGSELLLIAYAGQFAPNKGVIDFLCAAERVLEQSDRCRFVLVGRKDEENACYHKSLKRVSEKGLGDKIIFAGWITEMERAYAAMNLIVVPSRHEEAASNVIIEAMASSVPVIATQTGGSPELLRDGATGYLVEKEDPEQIAEKILLLERNRPLLEEMASAARQHAYDCFDVKNNAPRFEQTTLATLTLPVQS